jgi:hypothetical protein
MDDESDGAAAWESAYLRVREAVRLVGPDGQDVPEFVLHVDGGRAWWRWADEPFGEES